MYLPPSSVLFWLASLVFVALAAFYSSCKVCKGNLQKMFESLKGDGDDDHGGKAAAAAAGAAAGAFKPRMNFRRAKKKLKCSCKNHTCKVCKPKPTFRRVKIKKD